MDGQIRSHVPTPVLRRKCSECSGTGGFQSDNGPTPRISRCDYCDGTGEVDFRIDNVLALQEAIECDGWQKTYDAYRAAGYSDAETRRELEDYDEPAAVREV